MIKFDNYVSILCIKTSRQLGSLLRIKHLIGPQQRILYINVLFYQISISVPLYGIFVA